MRGTYWVCLAAAGLIAASGAAGAQSPGNESAAQNVQQSRQYESLLCSNPAFRARRMAQECGPLQGSQFYDGCVASFQCGAAPATGHWRHAPPSETIR